MFHELVRNVYWFCTDFMVNISNLLGLSYLESNFILFLIIFPALSIFLISFCRLSMVVHLFPQKALSKSIPTYDGPRS